ncbi:MAG: iron-containing alcohol dehydrogenase [Thermodesulfobacteriota bacterium]
MLEFNYHIPTKIRFGPGRSQMVGQVVKELGRRKPLIVTDEGLISAGLVKIITQSLEKEGIRYEIFSDVRSNPTIENVVGGTEVYKNVGADCLIGLGGGSPMDVSRGIGVIVVHGGKIEEFCSGKRTIGKPPPPIISIPTTAGTGSEVSPGGVVTDPISKLKLVFGSHLLFSEVALIDPELTYSLPPTLTAWTGLDALSHAVEGFLSQRSQPIVGLYSREAVRLISKHLVIAYRNGENQKARQGLMLAALLGGMAMRGGLGLVHTLAHVIGGHIDLPHGLNCALLLPEVMAHNLPAVKEKVALLAADLGVAAPDMNETQRAEAAVSAVRGLLTDLRVELPADLKIGDEALNAWVSAAMEYTRYQPNYPRQMTAKEMKSMLRRVFS